MSGHGNGPPAARQAGGLGLTEESHEPAASRAGLRAYAAALCVAPFAMIVLSLLWMASPAYRRHAQYPSYAGIGYGTRLRGADCEVVIEGDSSAMVGIEPAIVEQRTGLKTCNLGEMAGVKTVNGNMVLDEYLAHNRPPRLILFQFTPENFVPYAQWTQVSLFEGVFFRLQFRPDAGLLRWMVEHPLTTIESAELGARTGLPWLLKRPLPPELAGLRDRNQGWMPEPGETLTACPATKLRRAPDRAWIDALRAKYGVHGTTVLVDAMPEPACSDDRDFYAAELAGVADNALGTLPLQDYTDSGRLHTNGEGVAVLSARVSQQVAGLMRTSAIQTRTKEGR